ncbi:MAG: DUF59 domain-containing protein [Actinobacteria bacterium]|nr:DUF59 domain-containing protein [Actinomycetota bacterium]
MTAWARVLAALGTVYDPELDEPITGLRFVTSCDVSPDGDVDVRLRLPTPQCAPNFAFLMASDARAAVLAVPGVRDVSVVLEDHYTGREINDAVGHGGDLEEAFPGRPPDSSRPCGRSSIARRSSPGSGGSTSAWSRPASGRARSPRGSWPSCPRRIATCSAATSCAARWASTSGPRRRRSCGPTARRSPATSIAGAVRAG